MSREIWKDVIGYEGIYEVSSRGRIMRVAGGMGTTAGHIMKATRQRSGYLYVGLRRDGKRQDVMRVHRLVAEVFLDPAPSPQHQVNHKNGNKSDNRVENLEWVTASENIRHAFDILGREATIAPSKGEANGRAKVTRRDVKRIRKLYKNGDRTQRELAVMFGIGTSTVSNIIRRETWHHIS